MNNKNNKKRNVTTRTPTVGDVVLLLDDKHKPTQISRILEVDKSKGSEIRSCRVILDTTSKWWPVSKISFFEVGCEQSLPKKFKLKKVLPDKNLIFPRTMLPRLAKQNKNYAE